MSFWEAGLSPFFFTLVVNSKQKLVDKRRKLAYSMKYEL